MLIIVDEEILLDLAEDRFIIATQASKEKKIKNLTINVVILALKARRKKNIFSSSAFLLAFLSQKSIFNQTS